ncbi:hypothetical protein MALGJ_44320 [Mycolicibacter algericus]|uniref:Uncharacterized protein n=1 Tax=Mycolicibacter algericus TaxID=1288388 RepID=A0A7I9YGD8_MYCAL|nr:hypothetical protein MALGJ_44320 [Mycolicibacter algericus]
MIPVDILESLITALARWQGRGPSEDDTLHAGNELAAAAMAVILWDRDSSASEEPRAEQDLQE